MLFDFSKRAVEATKVGITWHIGGKKRVMNFCHVDAQEASREEGEFESKPHVFVSLLFWRLGMPHIL